MIMVLIIAFCFWFGGYAFKNPEKVWEYQHFLTVKDCLLYTSRCV